MPSGGAIFAAVDVGGAGDCEGVLRAECALVLFLLEVLSSGAFFAGDAVTDTVRKGILEVDFSTVLLKSLKILHLVSLPQ